MTLSTGLLLLPVGLLALVLLALAWELLRLLRAQAPAQIRSQLVGGAAPLGGPAVGAVPGARTEAPFDTSGASATGSSTAASAIPRVIWSYWNSDTLPPLIQACADNWRTQAPDHELRFLTPATLHRWLPEGTDITLLERLPPFRQADWLRLQLLQAHGGIWIDASTVLTGPLDWVHAQQARSRAEFVGFYIERLSRRNDQPMVENWFLAAVPGSRFIADLNAEFVRALEMGEARYLQALRDAGRFERVIQAIDPSLHEYLIMHVAASSLLDAGADRYRLHLQRAEDSAFALQQALAWKKRHLYVRLALMREPRRVPALVKLRGNDRRTLESQLRKRPLRPGSLLARYLPTLPRQLS